MQEIKKENIRSSFEFFKKMFKIDYDLVPARSSSRKVYLLIAILLFSAGLTFIVNSIEKYNTLSPTGTVLSILATVVLYIFIFHKNITVKKYAETSFLMQGQNRFVMNEEGITSYRSVKNNTTKEESTLLKWTDITGYHYKDNIILLYRGSHDFNYFDLNNYTQEEQKALLSWVKANIAPVQVVINAAAELEKQKNSGVNAFIAPPGKNSAIIIIIFSTLILISIIVSYLKYFG
jgi:hypothetical protein